MRRLRRILPHAVAIAGFAVVTVVTVAASRAQDATPRTVPEMWDAWCSRCHGKDGKGKVDQPTITVEPMDFTDCRVTSPEGDSDWEAVIARGGPVAGLSSQMPAFGDFLSPQQVTEFVAFIKKFCGETGWPSGNLNLPRPIFAEKAFPENEVILVPMVSHKKDEPVGFSFAAVYERRIGKRGQIEIGAADGVGEHGRRAIVGRWRLRVRREIRAQPEGLESSVQRGVRCPHADR